MTIADISHNSYKTDRKFYDETNYPRGLKRSGDFTLKEADLLEQYGVALKELANGTRLPADDTERQFVNVCQNKIEAQSCVEKAWLKYQNKTLTPKQFHTLFGSSKVSSSAS